MRVLDVSVRGTGSSAWLKECLDHDSAMVVTLESATLESAMTLLRQEVFDAVIVHHEDGVFNALVALGPIRAVAPDDLAIVVLGEESAEEMNSVCLDAAADAYVCTTATDVRTLLWVLARAAEWQRLRAESRSMKQTLERQRSQQHQEAVHQLRAQRSLLLEHHADKSNSDPRPPAWLVDYFLELLRIYVVSGTGNLRQEVTQLVVRLENCRVTLAEALSAHTLAAEMLVLGLGNRPAWHILGRANLLAYELIMQTQAQAAD